MGRRSAAGHGDGGRRDACGRVRAMPVDGCPDDANLTACTGGGAVVAGACDRHGSSRSPQGSQRWPSGRSSPAPLERRCRRTRRSTLPSNAPPPMRKPGLSRRTVIGRRQTANRNRQTAGNCQTADGKRPPTTRRQRPETGNRPQATGNRQTADCRPKPIARSGVTPPSRMQCRHHHQLPQRRRRRLRLRRLDRRQKRRPQRGREPRTRC